MAERDPEMDMLDDCLDEIDRLRAVNAELLAACKASMPLIESEWVADQLRVAIDKAESGDK